ncbi:dihydroorotase [Thermococcus cleftensis]|uniref:Dihydroorotase n=1 Tax=Thermococcus cleftensis (strain DSM 27260 / KACC 17922 / CL1) TaxID=163003 RepID=I3ZTT8_THECF|nr:dihydroorotase [Thermococcus cleftensis]AFL95122.1 dihydroorotase [Thermococcus cleftensis]
MYDLVLKGRFLTGGKLIEGSIGVSGGRILRVSRGDLKGEEIIQIGRGKVVLPGLIDVHVHLRDFEHREKETVETGTMAALHGGITVVFDMPNTKPPVTDSETFQRRAELFARKSYADYALGFLLNGNCVEARKAEADFYKIFMGASTGGIFSEDFKSDYSCAPSIVSVHAEDAEVIAGNPERPPEAEVLAIERALQAAENLEKPLNVCHVSTAGGIEAILRRNLPWVSFEVTPHHLFLTRKDFEGNPLLKVYPPLRDEGHRNALWRNFSHIPLIASDHAPHTPEDKEAGAAGIPGLETEVALLLDAVNRGMLELSDIVEKMHTNPIRIFGIRNKGFGVGKDADFTVVDLKREWTVKPEDFYTKAKWSPWEGRKLKGKVLMTLLRGRVVMEEDEIVGKPEGVRINAGKGNP